MKKILLVLIIVFVSAPFAFAEEAAPAKAEADKDAILTPGVIASNNRAPGSTSVDVNSGGAVPGDEVSPIAASVKSVKRGKCQVSLTNNHEKNRYSVKYRVEGTNKKGSTVLKRSYSSTIDPKKTVTKDLSCSDDLNMRVVLRSGKKL